MVITSYLKFIKPLKIKLSSQFLYDAFLKFKIIHHFIADEYRSHLIPVSHRLADNSDSGDDTDDLIEDARNFVMIGQR
jgi:hypothetical protein